MYDSIYTEGNREAKVTECSFKLRLYYRYYIILLLFFEALFIKDILKFSFRFSALIIQLERELSSRAGVPAAERNHHRVCEPYSG